MNYNTSTSPKRSPSGRAAWIHTQKSCKQRKEETVGRDPSFTHTHTHLTHTHTCTIRGSRVRRYEATNNNEYSTSFSLPSTLKCTHSHSHNHSQREEHRGAHGFRGGYEEVECGSAVEGSEMKKPRKALGGWASLFFQCAEAVLHVLH